MESLKDNICPCLSAYCSYGGLWRVSPASEFSARRRRVLHIRASCPQNPGWQTVRVRPGFVFSHEKDGGVGSNNPSAKEFANWHTDGSGMDICLLYALLARPSFDSRYLSWSMKSGRSENSAPSDHTLKESVALASSRSWLS